MELVLILISAIILLTYLWYKNRFRYWKKRGITTYSSTSLSEGLFSEKSYPESIMDYYGEFKSKKLRHGGVFMLFDPYYFPIDLKIIKSIMQDDFQCFMNTGLYINEEVDLLSAHLTSLEGSRWKFLRCKLTPVFTPENMKMMFDTVVQCNNNFVKIVDNKIGSSFDFQEISARFTTDLMAKCAFGLESNTLEDPENKFWKSTASVFGKSLSKNVTQFLIVVAPNLMKSLKVSFFPKEVRNFFIERIKEAVAYRESNKVSEKDFLHLLIQLKNHGNLLDGNEIDNEHLSEENKISLEELIAQIFLFFLVSIETCTPALSFCMYELATNKILREKAREHVKCVLSRHNGKLTYESLSDLDYLSQIINESFRKYPPMPMVQRECNKNYKIPDTDVVLEKGTKVMISIMGIHHDPEYYPQPENFDPERFTEASKKTRPPFSFIPFGEGPRMCMGVRFAMMHLKVGLATLLLNYEFSVNQKTKEPLKFDPEGFIPSAESGIWLDFKNVQ